MFEAAYFNIMDFIFSKLVTRLVTVVSYSVSSFCSSADGRKTAALTTSTSIHSTPAPARLIEDGRDAPSHALHGRLSVVRIADPNRAGNAPMSLLQSCQADDVVSSHHNSTYHGLADAFCAVTPVMGTRCSPHRRL